MWMINIPFAGTLLESVFLIALCGRWFRVSRWKCLVHSFKLPVVWFYIIQIFSRKLIYWFTGHMTASVTRSIEHRLGNLEMLYWPGFNTRAARYFIPANGLLVLIILLFFNLSVWCIGQDEGLAVSSSLLNNAFYQNSFHWTLNTDVYFSRCTNIHIASNCFSHRCPSLFD